MQTQSVKRSFVKNAILAALPPPDLAAVGSLLEPIVLKERMVLQEPRKVQDHVYFIESGVASLRMVTAGSTLETAVVGYRGVVGASDLFGVHIPTHQTVVIFPGNALRVRFDDLRRVVGERPQVRAHLQAYVQALGLHCAQSGFCGVRHCLGERLACWICLACDASRGHLLPVTHDYLSIFLGLRRPGVTEKLIQFEEEGLIHKMKGLVRVADRKLLEQKACGCYAIIAEAYASLILPVSGDPLAVAAPPD